MGPHLHPGWRRSSWRAGGNSRCKATRDCRCRPAVPATVNSSRAACRPHPAYSDSLAITSAPSSARGKPVRAQPMHRIAWPGSSSACSPATWLPSAVGWPRSPCPRVRPPHRPLRLRHGHAARTSRRQQRRQHKQRPSRYRCRAGATSRFWVTAKAATPASARRRSPAGLVSLHLLARCTAAI